MNNIKVLITIIATIIVVFGKVSAAKSNAPDKVLTQQEICSLVPIKLQILLPKSCSNWLKCPSARNLTDYEQGACVQNFYYNKDLKKCEYQDDVQCPYSSDTPKSKNRCLNQTTGTFLPDESDCSAFVYCSNSRESYSRCPNDLVYSPIKKACVYRTDYKCPEKKTSGEICKSVPDKTNFAHEDDCSQYNQCVNGYIEVKECSVGQSFDYNMGRCVQTEKCNCYPRAIKENTVCRQNNKTFVGAVADPDSCSVYYVCAKQKNPNDYDRHPTRAVCGNGYHFDESTNSCLNRVNVKCKKDRCEGNKYTFVNVHTDCYSYGICVNGKTTQVGKCPDKMYFDEKNQICTPQEIKYPSCTP